MNANATGPWRTDEPPKKGLILFVWKSADGKHEFYETTSNAYTDLRGDWCWLSGAGFGLKASDIDRWAEIYRYGKPLHQ